LRSVKLVYAVIIANLMSWACSQPSFLGGGSKGIFWGR